MLVVVGRLVFVHERRSDEKYMSPGLSDESDPTNLLFVCVDCLRGDAIADSWGETPFLDSFVGDATAFTRMHATATTTTPCIASLMTGTYSERNGVASLREARLSPDVTTLAERFAAADYETLAMVTGPLYEETDIDRGFDEYHYRDRDESLFGPWAETAVDRLDSLDDPFFAYVHLWELHKPIRVPDGYDDAASGRTPYERTLSALDAELERIVEAVPDDTVVVLHGDHGESISYRGHPAHTVGKRLRDEARYRFGLNTRQVEAFVDSRFGPDYHDHFFEDGHGETVFDFQTHVPFVLSRPDESGGERNETLCRQIDVFPTLLDVFGLDAAVDVDGESLLPTDDLDDRDAYVRACGASLWGRENWMRGVRTTDAKYVEYPNRDWPAELYDLRVDPEERLPLGDSNLLETMRRKLPTAESVETERLDIDERLQALGYR